MTPGTITAVTLLLAEVISAGASLSQIMADVKKTGVVSPERWAEVVSEIDAAEDLWDAAGP